MLPALDGAIGAMSEPMVSHDCVAFYLLSQEVAKHVKVVQSGSGRRRGVRRLPLVSPDGRPDAASLDGSVAAYRAAFFDRDTAGVQALAAAGYVADERPERAVRHRALRPRGRRRPASTARCGSTPP